METGSRWVVHDGEPLPPPRPGVRHVRIRWRKIIIIADDGLRRHIERRLYWPMMIVAVVLAPLLIFDLFYLAPKRELVGTWIWWLCVGAFGVIWLIFFVEFLIKIAIAECRIEYAKKNWLDIAIILLPAFLPLRAAYLVRSTRLFTLRGVGFRLMRAVITLVIGLQATEQLLHRLGLKVRSGRRDPDEMTRAELTKELRQLRSLTDAWEQWHQAHEAYMSKHSPNDGFHAPPPRGPQFMEQTNSSDQRACDETAKSS